VGDDVAVGHVRAALKEGGHRQVGAAPRLFAAKGECERRGRRRTFNDLARNANVEGLVTKGIHKKKAG
jgi:hypothetical protein